MIATGIRTVALFNNIMVAIKMGVILLFIVFGLFYINPDNWVPFIPENTGVFGEFGWSGIFRGAGVVFFAYLGFDSLATLAQECRNPQKDLPKGMIGSLTPFDNGICPCRPCLNRDCCLSVFEYPSAIFSCDPSFWRKVCVAWLCH